MTQPTAQPVTPHVVDAAASNHSDRSREAVVPPPLDKRFFAAMTTLWKREMVRFFRQRSRVVGALATPIVFWLLLGFGLDRAMVVGETADQAGVGFLAFFFPGTIAMIVLFTAIFSTISVIEDRREGFLQGVLVSPASRLSIVAGKVAGGASIAMIHAAIFLLAWPFVVGTPGVIPVIGAVLVIALLSVMLTALGLCFAWPMDSTAGFHAVMNLVLFPMWFLSGAVIPIDTAPIAMRVVMYLNPLTYGQAALAAAIHGPTSPAVGVPLWLSLPLLFAATAGLVLLCARIAEAKR